MLRIIAEQKTKVKEQQNDLPSWCYILVKVRNNKEIKNLKIKVCQIILGT